MSTIRAILAGVGWIDSNELTTGTCCLVHQCEEESRPCGIKNALGETMIVIHAIDMNILNRNKTKVIDNLSTVLMGEVVTFESNSLMNSCNDFLKMLS